MYLQRTLLVFITVTSASHGDLNGRKWTVASSNVVQHPTNQMLPVLKFCCPRHYYFDFVNGTCLVSGENLNPHFHSKDGLFIGENINFVNVTELINCPSYLLPNKEFRILTTGEIQLKDINSLEGGFSEIMVPNSEFCLLWGPPQNNSFELSALICFPEESEQVSLFNTVVNGYLIPISMGISAIFLAATFFIYCLVSELQDLLGKSFMCSIAALCFSKVFGVIGKTVSRQLKLTACITVGILMHLGFLLAFFWLNVISIILFVSVCFQERILNSSRRDWFTFGSIYAFGVPCLITILILVHDFTDQFDNSAVPKPGFGVSSCGFTNRGAQVVYFYAPISILLGINFILFCASACRLFLLSKQSSAFAFQFNHYLKLLVLMGIPWIFEVLSFFFAKKDTISTATFVWLAFDIFNALQGVIIFIVFACRRAVFARVSESICGSDYARKKYPDVFLQHANEETNDAFTPHDLSLMESANRL